MHVRVPVDMVVCTVRCSLESLVTWEVELAELWLLQKLQVLRLTLPAHPASSALIVRELSQAACSVPRLMWGTFSPEHCPQCSSSDGCQEKMWLPVTSWEDWSVEKAWTRGHSSWTSCPLCSLSLKSHWQPLTCWCCIIWLMQSLGGAVSRFLKVWGNWSYLNRNYQSSWVALNLLMGASQACIALHNVPSIPKSEEKYNLCKFKQHSVSELLTVKFVPCPVNFPAQCHWEGWKSETWKSLLKVDL